MPGVFDPAHNGGFVIDNDNNAIRLNRTLAAPPRTVFEAWTRPEHVSVWWDPTGAPLRSCTIDLRTGGAFAFVMAGEHGFAFAGNYLEIAPPQRLVFEALGAHGTVELTPTEGGTAMQVEIRCPSAEALQMFVKQGVHTGTAQTLDNLVAYVGHPLAEAS